MIISKRILYSLTWNFARLFVFYRIRFLSIFNIFGWSISEIFHQTIFGFDNIRSFCRSWKKYWMEVRRRRKIQITRIESYLDICRLKNSIITKELISYLFQRIRRKIWEVCWTKKKVFFKEKNSCQQVIYATIANEIRYFVEILWPRAT